MRFGRRPTQVFRLGAMPKPGAAGRQHVFPRHGGAALGHGTRKTSRDGLPGKRNGTLVLMVGLALSAGAQGQMTPEPNGSALALDRTVLDAAPAESWEDGRGLFGLRAAPLTEPLVTDRPDFTESTDAVPWGHAQLEIGYTFTYDREGDERTREHSFPETLLRIGLIEDIELRLGWSGVTMHETLAEVESRRGRRFGVTERDTGNDDLSVGFKFKLLEQDGLVPHFGVITAVSLPTGNATSSSGDVDPEVVLMWAYDVTDSFSVAGNFLLAVPTSEQGRFFQGGASLAGAVALTDKLGAYVEYFGLYPSDREQDAEHTLNGGFTYLITDNLQLDVLAGFGLNEQAPDFFAGVGISIRF